MAFKRDVDDFTPPRLLKVAELLFQDGIKNVSYYDGYIPSTNILGTVVNSEAALTPNYSNSMISL